MGAGTVLSLLAGSAPDLGLRSAHRARLCTPPLQAWGAVDWDRHQSCRRYLPEPVKLAKVTLALFPVVLYSMLVTLAVGLYCEFAEVCGGGLRRCRGAMHV